MNFKYVDISHIDATEPIFPSTQNWQTVQHYPFNAIDGAYIVEAAIERFIDSNARIPAEFTPGEDDVAWKTLRSTPLLHAFQAIQNRANPSTRQLFINTLPLVDKEGESSPDYSELLVGIDTVCTGESLVSRYAPCIDDLRGLYTDLKKFKRKNLYFTPNYDHLEYHHTNVQQLAPEGMAFSWYYDKNENTDTMYLRSTDSYGFFLEPSNVLDNQFEQVKMCIQYHAMRTATNNDNTSIVLQEDMYACEWVDGAIYENPTLGKLVAPVPQAYYSMNKSQQIIEHFFNGWSQPHSYEYEIGGQTFTSGKTVCGVDVTIRYLFADLKLQTTY